MCAIDAGAEEKKTIPWQLLKGPHPCPDGGAEMRRRTHGDRWPFAIILTVVLALAASPADLAAKDDGVQAVVQTLNTTLLDVMQSADTLGYRGRYEKLDPVLRSTFDFSFMAKIAVGRAWNELDKMERVDLVERFSKMSIATFASRFDGYSGEHFEIFGEKPGPRGTVIVDDRIVRPNDPAVGLNFVLKEQGKAPGDGGWRIIDVMLDGKFSRAGAPTC